MSHKSQAYPLIVNKRNAPELELWGVVGDDLLEFVLNRGRIVRAGNSEELIDLGVEVLGVTGVPTEDQDLLVGGGNNPLPLGDQLLTELLPRTEAYELDGDVSVGFKPMKAN